MADVTEQFICPSNGKVAFAGKIDADDVAFAGNKPIGRDGGGGFGAFAASQKLVGQEHGRDVGRGAFVFLGPDFGVVEAGAKLIDIDGQTIFDSFVDVDEMAAVTVFLPAFPE